VNTKTFDVKDPTGKFVNDINTKTLRFVGKPKDRIREDFLRIYRFYRFVSKGFKPEKKSLQACREHFNEGTKAVAPERIRAEIEKMIGL
jgi:poly(A) polymerase